MTNVIKATTYLNGLKPFIIALTEFNKLIRLVS